MGANKSADNLDPRVEQVLKEIKREKARETAEILAEARGRFSYIKMLFAGISLVNEVSMKLATMALEESHVNRLLRALFADLPFVFSPYNFGYTVPVYWGRVPGCFKIQVFVAPQFTDDKKNEFKIFVSKHGK